jgi:hypothetical protein
VSIPCPSYGPAPDAEGLLRLFRNREIRREMALFARTGRAIHAWKAYRWIREARLPVPPWFLEYLDECAARFDTGPKSPEDVAKAFDMDRKGRNPAVGSNQLAAVEHFWAIKAQKPGLAGKEIFAQVAEVCGVSERYVEDA